MSDERNIPVICSRIKAGMGNQMFQYARGFALAIRTGGRLLLDVSSFKKQSNNRRFELGEFQLGCGKIVKSIPKGLVNLRERKNATYSEEYKGGSVCLSGIWASEKYFVEYRPQLLSSFLLKQDISHPVFEQKGCIIGVHVRRTDTLKKGSVSNVCNMDYYDRAFREMGERFPGSTFVVFSDDPDWCEENFQGDCVIVRGNSPAEDISLMSRCHHHIIANSTFSWWGAWLCQHKKQTVIYPPIWARHITPNDKSDHIPDAWKNT